VSALLVRGGRNGDISCGSIFAPPGCSRTCHGRGHVSRAAVRAWEERSGPHLDTHELARLVVSALLPMPAAQAVYELGPLSSRRHAQPLGEALQVAVRPMLLRIEQTRVDRIVRRRTGARVRREGLVYRRARVRRRHANNSNRREAATDSGIPRNLIGRRVSISGPGG
jgi:hypothetical protein